MLALSITNSCHLVSRSNLAETRTLNGLNQTLMMQVQGLSPVYADAVN